MAVKSISLSDPFADCHARALANMGKVEVVSGRSINTPRSVKRSSLGSTQIQSRTEGSGLEKDSSSSRFFRM